MSPNLAHVYEGNISTQPLTVMTGLNHTESYLLTEISDHAKNLAPLLGIALLERIKHVAYSYDSLPMSQGDIQPYLQNWFLQLFQIRDKSNFKLSDSEERINPLEHAKSYADNSQYLCNMMLLD
jgi:hypothetical protein